MKARTVILISILSVGGLFITTPCFPGGPPDPLYIDSDGDSLCDDCEEWIFGTNPSDSDTDGDGIRDGHEDHDKDGLTNLEEQNSIESLRNAISDGDTEGVKSLLEYFPYVPITSGYHSTALMIASALGHSEIVDVFLQAGADVDDPDYRGNTALMWALWYDEFKIMQILLRAGADVNARNVNGETALMYEAGKVYRGVMPILLDVGADVNMQDKNGSNSHFGWGSRRGSGEADGC